MDSRSNAFDAGIAFLLWQIDVMQSDKRRQGRRGKGK